MEDTEIIKILNRYNPWWDNKPIPESKTINFKREEFYTIKSLLDRREINSIIGPRRVGKTVIIHQLIQDLLNKGISPTKILYLSIDEVELNRGGAELKHILEAYFKYIVKKPIDNLDSIHYLFLDEIQELRNWEKILKNWYDLGYKIKFVISGSSSIWISKGTEESLLGRIKTSVMMPLKFSEVLRYKNILPENFSKEREQVLSSIIESIQKKDVKIFKKELDRFFGLVSPKRDAIELELDRYLVVGGYPEFLEEKEYSKIGESIRDKIRLIFFKDIVRYFNIRNPKVLEDLFKLLARNSGTTINLVRTAGILDIQRPTLKDYLKYLTKAYLIKSSEFYSNSRKTRIRKQTKVYVLDSGIRNGISDFLDDALLKDEAELGKIVEGIIFDHLVRLKFDLEPGPEPDIFYWRNKKEIDFVIEIKRKPIPIESKYSSSLPETTINEIKDFLKEYRSPFGIVITKDLYKIQDEIIRIPFWLFLLLA